MQSNGNTIAQNYVGTTYDGLEASANQNDQGIVVTGSGNTIGGVGAGNLVSGNDHVRDPDRRLRRGARQRRSRPTSSARTRPGTSLCRTTSASRPSTARCTRVIGGTSAAEGNVVFGAGTGIDIQGIAGVPDNSEIRFNNVGVGKDGTTTLGTLVRLGGRRQQRRRRDHRRQRRRERRERPRARELERPHRRAELRRRRPRGRRPGERERGHRRPADGSASGRRTCSSATTRSASTALQGIIISNADRTTVSGNVSSDNGEGVSVSGNNNTIGPGNTHRTTTSRATRASRCTRASATRSRRTRSTATQGLGIDLVGAWESGVTANDAGDADTGPNGLQNFPVLSSASADGASLDVAYSLDSKPNTAYTIEFFAQTGCDASGNGQGADLSRQPRR